MNVTLNKTDSVNAAVTIEVAKSDYIKEVDNSLKDLRKNAVVDGFRKGMVPQSLIRQKYGKSVLIEKLNEVVSKRLSDFIEENKLFILGEPLASEENEPIDFDKQEDFVFTFDIGLSPEINVELTKEDKIIYFLIQVSDEMIDKQIEQYKLQFGNYQLVEDVETRDLVKGKLIELDENGEPKPGGITAESAVVMPLYIKDEDEKSKFLNAKLHDKLVFNPHKAYEGNEAELASFLNIKKEETKNFTGDFSFEIIEISRYIPGEVNQDLFDKVFGEGAVDSEETFREKIKENTARQLISESDYKLALDVRNLLEKKGSDLILPETFLKRWLSASDSKLTPESIETDYPKIADDLKYRLIREHLIEKYGITIEENELQDYAKRASLSRFAQYGMYDVPDDLLEKYATEMLKKKEVYRSLGEKAFEDKLMVILKDQVTLEPCEVTLEEFKTMVN